MATETARNTARRNMLVILSDQQRWDTLGCYGAPMCRTPHADRLAARGVRFDAAFTGSIACSPSRASLFTGLYPHRHEVIHNNLPLKEELPTLTTELGGAGYHMGYAGKWHVDHAHVPSEHGFEGYDHPGYGYPLADGRTIHNVHYHTGAVQGGMYTVPDYYRDYLARHGYETPRLVSAHYGESLALTKKGHEIYGLQTGTIEETFEAMVAEQTIDLLRRFAEGGQSGAKPFLIWANFWGPHTPCLVPEPYYSMYDPADIPVEPSFVESWERKPRRHKIWEAQWGLSGDGWRGWREIVARYWGYCTMLDDLLGRILDELDALGLTDSTMVAYTTDHGDAMGAHRIIEKGPFGYEEAYRLPLIVAHPDCENPGSASSEFVYLQDFYPTALEEAGLPEQKDCDFDSIRDLALGRDVSMRRDSVYAHGGHSLPSTMRMLRTSRFKLVLTPSAESTNWDLLNDPWEIWELYDLENDPHELTNLIATPGAAVVQGEMLRRMNEWMTRTDDPMLPYFQTVRRALG